MAAIDINALQSFSPVELLKLTEYRIAQILAGAQAWSQSGRQLTNADLSTLYDERNRLKEEIAALNAGEAGGGNVLVIFGREQ